MLEIRLIEEVDVDVLGQREAFWIKTYRDQGYDLVNVAPGGSTGSLGYRHTSDAKKKISVSGQSRKGKKASDETRRKISLSLIGNQRRLGKSHSDETKQKIALSKSGTVPWNKGIKATEKHRRNLSESKRGVPKKPRSEEHRARIAQSKREMWKRRRELALVTMIDNEKKESMNDLARASESTLP
jgi:group I intron endonuclease